MSSSGRQTVSVGLSLMWFVAWVVWCCFVGDKKLIWLVKHSPTSILKGLFLGTGLTLSSWKNGSVKQKMRVCVSVWLIFVYITVLWLHRILTPANPESRHFFRNPAKSGYGQISSRISTDRPVSHSHFSPTPADSLLGRRQPTHIG